ncbi:MAG: Gfo/Idh/MocA family oxidoreductase [Planctomycetales bacterium]
MRIGVIGVGDGDGARREPGQEIKGREYRSGRGERLSEAGDPAKNICKGEGYLDYRKLLERQDIDAILIARRTTGTRRSRWMRDSGKHVYCEKLMTHTVEQAVELRNAVRKAGSMERRWAERTAERSAQAAPGDRDGGDQRMGAGCWRGLNAGSRLFKTIRRSIPQPGRTRRRRLHRLGHVAGTQRGLPPKIAWNPEHFFRFRKYWPYNGGVATDLLYHKLGVDADHSAGSEWRVSVAGECERDCTSKRMAGHSGHVHADGGLPQRMVDFPGQHADE